MTEQANVTIVNRAEQRKAIAEIVARYNTKFSAEEIESKQKITPTIKLKINNNRIDTIYVYKIK